MSFWGIKKNDWRDMAFVVLALCLCCGLQQATYSMRYTWPGIAPAPQLSGAQIYGFGDAQFAYRNIGLMLQNAGDTGGRVTNLRDYDYAVVHDWLWLSYALDPRANYVPSLAAYYFGATKVPSEVAYLVDYLATVGQDARGEGERWRWLAHAVYLARFVMVDQNKALELAYKLAAVDTKDMPIWTKQMPAYVMSNVGQKKAARDLLLTIAATDKGLELAEINQTCWYINEHLREPGDGLDSDKVYRFLCSHEWDTHVNKK